MCKILRYVASGVCVFIVPVEVFLQCVFRELRVEIRSAFHILVRNADVLCFVHDKLFAYAVCKNIVVGFLRFDCEIVRISVRSCVGAFDVCGVDRHDHVCKDLSLARFVVKFETACGVRHARHVVAVRYRRYVVCSESERRFVNDELRFFVFYLVVV